MTIRIEGLTVKQKALMDIMWSMDDIAKVNAFIRSLPRHDACDAQSLVSIAVWETLELEQGLEAYADSANSVIARAQRS
jgi:hypothetical protein